MNILKEIQKELDKKTLEIQELKRTLEEAKNSSRFTSIGSSVYTLCADGSVCAIIYKDDLYDRKTIDQGSLFRTREEAEEEMDRDMKKCWRAVCDKCGYVERHRSSTKFLDPWFLPDRCPQCDHWKRPTKVFDTGWSNQYGYYERKQKFNLFKPSTWFSDFRWKEIE